MTTKNGKKTVKAIVVDRTPGAKPYGRRVISVVELAMESEARGMTSPDKHDLMMVVLGGNVRIAEVGVDLETNKVAVRAGETSVAEVRKMLSMLPDNHNLGIVSVTLGADFDCEAFLEFIKQQAGVKKFSFTTMHGPRKSKAMYDDFFTVIEGGPTMGNC